MTMMSTCLGVTALPTTSVDTLTLPLWSANTKKLPPTSVNAAKMLAHRREHPEDAADQRERAKLPASERGNHEMAIHEREYREAAANERGHHEAVPEFFERESTKLPSTKVNTTKWFQPARMSTTKWPPSEREHHKVAAHERDLAASAAHERDHERDDHEARRRACTSTLLPTGANATKLSPPSSSPDAAAHEREGPLPKLNAAGLRPASANTAKTPLASASTAKLPPPGTTTSGPRPPDAMAAKLLSTGRNRTGGTGLVEQDRSEQDLGGIASAPAATTSKAPSTMSAVTASKALFTKVLFDPAVIGMFIGTHGPKEHEGNGEGRQKKYGMERGVKLGEGGQKEQVDRGGRRALAARQVRGVLGRAGLAEGDLERVAALAGIGRDGTCSFGQFVSALHLARSARAGAPLPGPAEGLPEALGSFADGLPRDPSALALEGRSRSASRARSLSALRAAGSPAASGGSPTAGSPAAGSLGGPRRTPSFGVGAGGLGLDDGGGGTADHHWAPTGGRRGPEEGRGQGGAPRPTTRMGMPVEHQPALGHSGVASALGAAAGRDGIYEARLREIHGVEEWRHRDRCTRGTHGAEERRRPILKAAGLASAAEEPRGQGAGQPAGPNGRDSAARFLRTIPPNFPLRPDRPPRSGRASAEASQGLPSGPPSQGPREAEPPAAAARAKAERAGLALDEPPPAAAAPPRTIPKPKSPAQRSRPEAEPAGPAIDEPLPCAAAVAAPPRTPSESRRLAQCLGPAAEPVGPAIDEPLPGAAAAAALTCTPPEPRRLAQCLGPEAEPAGPALDEPPLLGAAAPGRAPPREAPEPRGATPPLPRLLGRAQASRKALAAEPIAAAGPGGVRA
ncbi:unnamed protein product [Prorocentrum cordatum]|uniref:Uncharacterized protein n=1 Tax=Prorocentrum cordatum TaxID=2364126 RepID=A0ABN9YAM5_9DINO|nr:unnamed protein product [Polarella glacialis]